MKKTLMLAVTALSMGACTNQTDVILPETPQEVSLTAVTQKATRSALSSDRLDPSTEMYVFATKRNDTEYESWFDNKVFKNMTTNNQNPWTGGYNYLPEFSAYEFMAYTTDLGEDKVDPTSAELNLDKENKRIKSLVLNYENKLKGKTDVLVSDIAKVTKNTEGKYAAFTLTFHHALSWIMINFTGTSSGVMVNEVCIPDARMSGEFTSNYDDSGTFNDKWTNVSEENAFFPSYTKEGGMIFDEAVGKTAKGLLVIPGDQTNITFKYQIKQGDSFPNEWTTHIIKPESGAKWEAGKKYIYNISVTTQEVSITAKVQPWDQTTDNTITM